MGRKRFLALVMALSMLFTLMAPAFAFADGDYYLVGSMNGWSAQDSNYMFTENAGVYGEYCTSIVYFQAGTEFIAISASGTRYPSEGPNYVIGEAGDYIVYFRPSCDGGSDWHFGCLYAVKQQHTHIPAEAGEENYVMPTCTQAGSYISVVRCSVCGEVISSTPGTISPLGHDFGEWVQTTAPNCTTAGEETSTCSRCGATQTRPVDMLGHDMVHYDAQGATCTEIGWNAYQACSRCDYKIDYEELPATGHTEAIDAAVVPTCTETGLTEGKHCSVCNAVIVAQEVVPATGHTLNHVDAVAATVNTYGNIEYWTCDVCNKYFSDANAEHEIEAGNWVIPALAVTQEEQLGSEIHIDESNFPDEAFRNYVSDHVDGHIGDQTFEKDGYLSAAEIAAVKSINIPYGCKDVAGITIFSAVEQITFLATYSAFPKLDIFHWLLFFWSFIIQTRL